MSVVEPGGKNRTPLVLVILLVAQLLSMSWYGRTKDGRPNLLLSWVLTAVYPVQKAGGGVGSVVSGLWNGYIDLRGAKEENTKLREQNDQLKQDLFKLKEELAASKRVTATLELQQTLPYRSVAAQVIARSGNEFFNKIIIDKGRLAGIKLHQAVITPAGVVGRVIGLGPVAAQVQLLTDSYAGVGAQLSESRAYGEVKGVGKAFCEMRNVSGLEPVKEGEAIITTGLDGIYPKGLLIGYVQEVGLGSGAKSHRIVVKPAAQLDALQQVLVLELSEQDLKIDETVK
ncbi:MAG: rod shape-determining protein MreC [Acidobacteria bacterium]|nr:rod shape-determining protein MreC [Acidobacteriota bacterium]